MKRTIIAIWLMALFFGNATAQSTMSDDQIIKFVMKEQKAGTSQTEIVTKLVQKGVDIEQIRRVRKKYERASKSSGLGNVKSDGINDDKEIDARLRRNKADGYSTTTEKLKDDKLSDTRKTKKDKYKKGGLLMEDEEEKQMKGELDAMLPDSLDLYDRQVIRNYLRDKARKEGKDGKKVFGRDIFNNEELSFEPNMNMAMPDNYILGPGDNVFVDVYGASQKSAQVTVAPDGYINIEDFGPIQVAGLTVVQANNRVRQQMGTRYSSSKIRLSVGQTRSIVVNVMGEVKTPGTYTLSAFASVFHALYMAGGPNDIGTLRNIKVYRNSRLVSTVDVYDYILNGKLSGNVTLGDNDVIIVGPYECMVNVKGKVKRPMFYEMKKNESLGTLIDYAGGFAGDAYTKSVRVIRKSGAKLSVFNVNEFDLGSFHLADNDSVSIDSMLPRYSNMVELKGAVFRPGMYQLGEHINSVKTLLENADGVTEEAFTAHAVMHRMKPDRTLEVLSVDLKGVLDGTIADIPLRENDVLFVPTKQEAQIERTITIHGEVMYPGIYQYADNETLEDFILQAGGLKESASTVKVDVARRIVDPQALVADTVIAHTYSFALKDGFVVDGETGFTLMPFDEVYVRQSPGYNKQQNVTIEGEVMFAGTYTLSRKNQRLSDLIKMAGGVNDRAFAQGARLERKYTQQERQRAEAVLKKTREDLEASMQEQAARTGNANLANLSNTEQLKKYQVGETYPVGIELDKALANPGGTEDIVLREGDRIYVPQYEATVKINGEVLYPNTVGYVKGKSVGYYIDQAGGFSSKAKKRQTYIIYMNGTVAKVGHNAKPMPGCEIVVPSKSINKTSIAETLSIATGVGSLAAIIATLANLLK